MQGDCLELMKDIPDGSVDMVLTDPPYGTTACKWDSIIPFEPMWEQLKRIIKPNGAIALFGSEPFSSLLRCSNMAQFKYDWIWHKDKATNHLNAKKQPMRKCELISVFYKKQANYNPQLIAKDPRNIRPPKKIALQSSVYGKEKGKLIRSIPDNMGYPNECLFFNGKSGKQKEQYHPTQKPVALMEYLISTYTNEGEVVLDFTMGSGTTGVACKNLNRKFIGIELDENYFNIAKDRILNA
tara:strand:- start:3585 stop:4304 length:720 start_codon:yes stop_codon:yes gene_type:complete